MHAINIPHAVEVILRNGETHILTYRRHNQLFCSYSSLLTPEAKAFVAHTGFTTGFSDYDFWLIHVPVSLTADVSCFMPANGETTTVTTNPSVPVDISLNLLKREIALGGVYSIHHTN